MRVRKILDCEKTDPPSSAFAVMIDPSVPGDSETEFVSELLDLVHAGRAVEHLKNKNVLTEENILMTFNHAKTPRVIVSSLANHLLHSPSTSELYRNNILNLLELEWVMPEDLILSKAFLIRTFWY